MATSEQAARLLEYEAGLRAAGTRAELGQRIVSGLDPIVGYVNAVLLLGGRHRNRRAVQVSDVARVDRTAPFVVFSERLEAGLARLRPGETGAEGPPPDAASAAHVSEYSTSAVDSALQAEWRDLAAPVVVRIRLPDPWRPERTLGVLLLFRQSRLRLAEREVLEHLAGSMGHALAAQSAKRRLRVGRLPLARVITLSALGLIAVTALIPFRLSVTAQAEISPRDAVVIAAPLNGVVERVRVSPNQSVARGESLVVLETDELDNAVQIARQELFVARSELRAVQQAAFASAEEKARINELEARVTLAETELAHAESRLARAQVRAPEAGVAILEDRSAWRGRPVQTGERILSIADPGNTQITVRLPVADAIPLAAEARVRLFLDSRPLDVIEARLDRLSFVPTQTPDGLTVYRGVARYTGDPGDLRIGAQGIVKLYGEPSTLFMFLFRRPITWVAQTFNL